MADLCEIVGAHQPDEVAVRKPSSKLGEGIGGVAGAEPGLEVCDGDPGVPHQGARTGEARLERGHALDGLQRVLRRHQPPDFGQVQALQGLEADVQVAAVGGIERAAEQPDPAAGAARQ